jgi:hypothetical protein
MFVVEIFKIIDWIKSKANQIYLTSKNNPRCDVHMLLKKFNCRKIVLVTTIFGGLSVFSLKWIIFIQSYVSEARDVVLSLSWWKTHEVSFSNIFWVV